MKNKIYKTLIITLSLCLTGCMGIYEGGFECPAGSGVGCKSISEVNALVNLGGLPKSSTEKSSEIISETDTCHSCGHSSFLRKNQPEIWINPLYLKRRQKTQQEEQLKDRQEERTDIRSKKEIPHGTISL